jgi:hypothetical protein
LDPPVGTGAPQVQSLSQTTAIGEVGFASKPLPTDDRDLLMEIGLV